MGYRRHAGSYVVQLARGEPGKKVNARLIAPSSPATVQEPEAINAVSKVGLTSQRSNMNSDQLKGNWKQLVGRAKEKWGKLTMTTGK
jgi:hypothetical protein